MHAEFVAQTIGTQAEKARIPYADGTLVATPGQPDPELIPSLLAVGTQESFMQAVGTTRAGGHLGYVGVNHEVTIPGIQLFFAGIHTLGGPAPVRRFLPDLIELIWDGRIDPGKVFDLELPLERAAEGYEAMDQRRATKVLLTL